MTKYTGYLEVSLPEDAQAMDIPTMFRSNAEQYRDYILENLLFQDHHGNIRSMIGEFPLATTQKQVDVLIEVLNEWRDKMDD